MVNRFLIYFVQLALIILITLLLTTTFNLPVSTFNLSMPVENIIAAIFFIILIIIYEIKKEYIYNFMRLPRISIVNSLIRLFIEILIFAVILYSGSILPFFIIFIIMLSNLNLIMTTHVFNMFNIKYRDYSLEAVMRILGYITIFLLITYNFPFSFFNLNISVIIASLYLVISIYLNITYLNVLKRNF